MHNDEEVIYIEYVDGIPQQVLTAPLESHGLSWFNFEYVYGDRKDIRYYEAGGGGRRDEIQAPHFVSKKGNVYWMSDGCKFKGKTKAINCKQIKKPLIVRGFGRKQSINPFKIADETSYGFEWCNVCETHSCDGEGCSDHQQWSDEEGCLVYNHDGSRVE